MSVTPEQMEDQLNPFRIDEDTQAVSPKPQEGKTLTLQDIKSSRYLWENGVMPGDVFKDGEVIRKFSDAESTRSTGKRLTEQDIENSAYLQANNIKPGDIFTEDGEIIRTESDSVMRQFMYGFDESGNDVTYAASWLEQYIPMGDLAITDGLPDYISADEKYGEGYVAASPTERRDMQARARERALLSEYGEYFQPEGAAYTAGQVTKALATPTTLLPVGQTVKGATAIGAGLGLGYSTTEQLATTGEFDPEKAIVPTLAGGVGAGAITALAKGVGKGINAMAEKSSADLVKKVQAKTYQKQGEGLTRKQALDSALEELNISQAEFARAATMSGNKVRLTANADKAAQELDAMVQSDSAVSRLIVPSLDKYLGTLSTRIKNISEPVFGAVRKFEYKTHYKTASALEETANFTRQMGKLSDGVKNPLARMLFNGNFKAARGILKENAPDLLKEFDDIVVPTIRRIGSELQQAGYKNVDLGIDYFPRLVKDLDGLRRSFGVESRGAIDEAIISFAKAKGIETKNVSLEDLYKKIDKSDVDMVIEKVIRNEPVRLADGKLLKPRKIEKLRQDQLQYYASPEEALQMYIRRSVHDTEKRMLFGRGMENEPNTEASIQRYVANEIREGNISADKQQEMVDLLRARFVGGEEPLGGMANFLRDTGYAGTIANPLTALIQLGDLAQSAAFNGLRNTLASLFGTKNMKIVDLGVQQASADLLSPRKTANILNKLFKVSGFSRLDQLAKETTINAALNKYAKGLQSTNPNVKQKALDGLRKKYGKVYGDEFDALVADLTNSVKSENTKLLAFHELSDYQPISLSEMPQGYLEARNGRLLYMLKSFTLKQYDIVRRNILQEWQAGNKKLAARNMAVLAGYITATNMGVQAVRDMIYGREVRPEDIPSKAAWSLLGVYGANQYLTERYFRQGEFKEGAVNYLVPATPIIDSVLTLGADVLDEDTEIELMRYTRAVPVVGPLLYAWFGGGTERYNDRLE